MTGRKIMEDDDGRWENDLFWGNYINFGRHCIDSKDYFWVLFIHMYNNNDNNDNNNDNNDNNNNSLLAHCIRYKIDR